MAKAFFPFEETIICATGILIGAIVAIGVKDAQDRTPPKPGKHECFCNQYDLPLNNNIGRLTTESTLEVML